MYHMKILIPCITAGAIIGKGGETIAQLQTETNTKIKMSKTNDFYPGESIFCLQYHALNAVVCISFAFYILRFSIKLKD